MNDFIAMLITFASMFGLPIIIAAAMGIDALVHNYRQRKHGTWHMLTRNSMEK